MPKLSYEFEKWHGCLNDFIVIRLHEGVKLTDLKEASVHLCSRSGGGIGADGILVLQPLQDGSHQLTIINSDGSLAETCGNGIRCGAAFLKSHGYYKKIGKGAGLSLTLQSGSQVDCLFPSAKSSFVSVSMGKARALSKDSFEIRDLLQDLELKMQLPVSKNFELYNILNNHIVIKPGVPVTGLAEKLGPPLQAFDKGDGINVHIIEPLILTDEDQKRAEREADITLSRLWKAVSWERGAGETMACGSGACSVACYSYSLEPDFIWMDRYRYAWRPTIHSKRRK